MVFCEFLCEGWEIFFGNWSLFPFLCASLEFLLVDLCHQLEGNRPLTVGLPSYFLVSQDILFEALFLFFIFYP